MCDINDVPISVVCKLGKFGYFSWVSAIESSFVTAIKDEFETNTFLEWVVFFFGTAHKNPLKMSVNGINRLGTAMVILANDLANVLDIMLDELVKWSPLDIAAISKFQFPNNYIVPILLHQNHPLYPIIPLNHHLYPIIPLNHHHH
jgi:hypothetical protein